MLYEFWFSKDEGAQTMGGIKGTGTLRFQSPELIEGEERTFKSDVFAFGMLIYQVSIPIVIHNLLKSMIVLGIDRQSPVLRV